MNHKNAQTNIVSMFQTTCNYFRFLEMLSQNFIIKYVLGMLTFITRRRSQSQGLFKAKAK